MHDIKIIEREIEVKIRFLLTQFPVVAVIGPRQCGKTTVCQRIGENWTCFDLEKDSDFQLISHDPELFLKKHLEQIVIDEVQLLPPLFSALRVSIDSMRSKKNRFLITGSSSPDLLTNISETLAGRVAILELSTLKATERWGTSPSRFYDAIANNINVQQIEQLTCSTSDQQLWDSWLCGGYPEPVFHLAKEAYPVWMENYRSTYINRDIRRLFPRLNIDAFRRFISMLASLSGSILNYAELSRSLSVSQPTVRDYLDIAHGTFIWRKLPPYEKNIKKRIVKMPRGHLRDSGLLHYLLNIDEHERLTHHPIVGRSWESFVIEEILKGMQNNTIPHQAYYYRTSNGAEIDLILEGTFGLLPIEIKFGTKIDHRSLRTLIDFVDNQQCPLGIVINNSDSIAWLHEKIIRLPATMI